MQKPLNLNKFTTEQIPHGSTHYLPRKQKLFETIVYTEK